MRQGAGALGLRSIALFEMTKGLVATLAGLTVIVLRHRDLITLADDWLARLHVAPDGHTARALEHAVRGATVAHLWLIAFGCFAYAAVRAVEAYGLWHARQWAEWFALLSGALYLPWELFEWVEKTTTPRTVLLFSNTAFVLFLLYRRVAASARDRTSG